MLWLGLPIAVLLLVLYLSSAVFFVQRGGGESLFRGITYKAFVAQRYLLVAQPKVTKTTKWVIAGLFLARLACQLAFGAGLGQRGLKNPIFDLERVIELALVVVIVGGVLVYSRPALFTFFFGLFVTAVGFALYFAAVKHIVVHFHVDEIRHTVDIPGWYSILALVLMAGGAILSGLALFFGFLRAFFTFFTTVPIGGVWIGTAALVCVLAVMSGFETDLREKILGSNAHIQVTTSDTHVGDFTEWRAVTKQIMAIPGVVASTPYGVSEVVLASNNNGLPMIIKGIDPKTVGKVTKLIDALEDKKAINDLEEKVDPTFDLRVQEVGAGSGVVDPPPPDLPSSDNPIDYSGSAEVPATGSNSGSGSAAGAISDTMQMPLVVDDVPPIDGPDGSNDAILDPPPPDLVTSDAPPIDYSKPRTESVDPEIHILDIAPDSPSVMKRTESLPGILVGRELVKQMHLYVGQEVRLVSPLSDPSNPDATGTPIPFNRDYRIAGIFFTGMYEYDLKFAYITNDSLQTFLDRGDPVDGIEIRIPSPDDTDEYVKTISEKLGPNYRVQDWKELNRSLFSALKLEKIAMFLVLGIVIIVASFSIVGNLIMVVVEKQREIALLKTLGASDAGIMQLFAIQGLLIGLIGTLLGVATGLAACYVGKRIGIPLNPDVYYIDQMPVNVDPQSVALTFGAGVFISILATFYPALLGARVRPATGMRH
ncbi:MAG: ABC transporter permease [Kofleriaceae bacterium]